MDLLDRYLTAVAFWLPLKQGRDVTAELRDDIRSEIESREEDLRRPLTHAEVEDILTRWGHPMRVAERYLPARSLIGPALLPVYFFVLRIFATVLGGWLVALGGLALWHPGFDPAGERLYDALHGVFIATLCVFALVTLLFAAAERSTTRARRIETWTAAQLVPADARRDRRHISRLGAAIELAIGMTFVALWMDLGAPGGGWTIGDQVVVTWTPIVPALYWAVLAVAVAGVVMSIFNFSKPRWTVQRLGLQMAIDSLALVLVLLMMPMPAFTVTAIEAPAHKVARLVAGAQVSWVITLLVVAVCLTFALYESYRRLAPPPRAAGPRL